MRRGAGRATVSGKATCLLRRRKFDGSSHPESPSYVARASVGAAKDPIELRLLSGPGRSALVKTPPYLASPGLKTTPAGSPADSRLLADRRSVLGNGTMWKESQSRHWSPL